MDSGKLVFAQLMAFMPRHDFDLCVRRYDGDRRLRGFSCRVPPEVEEEGCEGKGPCCWRYWG